jgi:hypothetical protein
LRSKNAINTYIEKGISEMGSYSIVKKPEKLVLTLEGRFDEETAGKFFKDFTNETSKIVPSQYSLEVVATELNVVSPDMQESLKSCFKLYQSIGFKKVLMQLKGNAILAMQVKRIAADAGLDNFEII